VVLWKHLDQSKALIAFAPHFAPELVSRAI